MTRDETYRLRAAARRWRTGKGNGSSDASLSYQPTSSMFDYQFGEVRSPTPPDPPRETHRVMSCVKPSKPEAVRAARPHDFGARAEHNAPAAALADSRPHGRCAICDVEDLRLPACCCARRFR